MVNDRVADAPDEDTTGGRKTTGTDHDEIRPMLVDEAQQLLDHRPFGHRGGDGTDPGPSGSFVVPPQQLLKEATILDVGLRNDATLRGERMVRRHDRDDRQRGVSER